MPAMRTRYAVVALVLLCVQGWAQPPAPGIDTDATMVSASFRMDALDPGELGLGAGQLFAEVVHPPRAGADVAKDDALGRRGAVAPAQRGRP